MWSTLKLLSSIYAIYFAELAASSSISLSHTLSIALSSSHVCIFCNVRLLFHFDFCLYVYTISGLFAVWAGCVLFGALWFATKVVFQQIYMYFCANVFA